MTYRERFIDIFTNNIRRDGAQTLLEWLNSTDFFTAPASTKYHGACECGLVMHSISVYQTMMDKHFDPENDSAESFAICGLLHDLCKVKFYKTSTKNVKNEVTGQWEQKPYYTVDDAFPYGHGEKSVYLIERFMRLSPEEAIAIRWHMGGFDESAKSSGFSIGRAYYKYPLAVKLHLSDMESTYLREKNTSAVDK